MTKLGALLAVAVFDVWVFAATTFDFNVILNVVMLVIVAIVALPVIRIRRKDATIKDLQAERDAMKVRRDGALEDLKGAQVRANLSEDALQRLRVECAELQARYDEQSRYTAEPAVLHLEQELSEHRRQVAERHEKILEGLEKLTARLDRLNSQ